MLSTSFDNLCCLVFRVMPLCLKNKAQVSACLAIHTSPMLEAFVYGLVHMLDMGKDNTRTIAWNCIMSPFYVYWDNCLLNRTS